MAARYVLKNSPPGQYHFALKAGNNEIILSSERYMSKAGALDGIDSVKENSPHDFRYERTVADNGEPMFNLKAGNGQVIGTGETYSSVAAREAGIASCKANGPIAPVDDQT